MYAAAGGASIANRRKQKRLQLNKRDGAGAAQAAAAARARSLSAHTPVGQRPGQQQHGKPTLGQQQQQRVVPSLQLSLPSSQIVQPATYGFHSSHERNRSRGNRRSQIERDKSSSAVATNFHNINNKSHNLLHSTGHNRHRLLAPPPISPIIQFPISPPPLSLESPNSLVANVTQAIASKTNVYGNNNSSSTAAVAFPFPPPSFLEPRVSPTTSEPQCGSQGPGKAAWQGCARPSPLPLSPASPQGSRGEGYKTKQCEAHRRWMKRNRIRDASYCYGSSGEDDDLEDYEDGTVGPGGIYEGRASVRRRGGEVNAAVNTVLYAGLGTTALGLVISFVGTGEKGFSSPELRLVGPSLLCAGLLCCLLRVLLCLCLCRCCGECRWRACDGRLVKGKKSPKTADRRDDRTKNPIVDKSDRSIVIATAGGAASSLLERGRSVAANARSSTARKQQQQQQRPPSSANLLPVHPPASTSHQRQQRTPVPSSSSSSSCSTAKSHKAHELLLSPAQLPE